MRNYDLCRVLRIEAVDRLVPTAARSTGIDTPCDVTSAMPPRSACASASSVARSVSGPACVIPRSPPTRCCPVRDGDRTSTIEAESAPLCRSSRSATESGSWSSSTSASDTLIVARGQTSPCRGRECSSTVDPGLVDRCPQTGRRHKVAIYVSQALGLSTGRRGPAYLSNADANQRSFNLVWNDFGVHRSRQDLSAPT